MFFNGTDALAFYIVGVVCLIFNPLPFFQKYVAYMPTRSGGNTMFKNYEEMKSILADQMCDVLDNHGIGFKKGGVEKNLDCYSKNKASLINLLSQHPKWNDDAMGVIFESGDIRLSSEADITSLRIELEKISKEVFTKDTAKFTVDDISEFTEIIEILCNEGQFIVEDTTVSRLGNLTDVGCKVGERTSRVIDKLCKAYDINNHVDYITVFTPLADALNPISISHKVVLSLHPCDFLRMSDGNGWDSNFRLGTQDRRGNLIAGTLGYMNDEVSMVFYTVDENAKIPCYKAHKTNSQIFSYSNGILHQSRLYPNHMDESVKTIFRNIVQQVIADCLGEPNLWRLLKPGYANDSLFKTEYALYQCDDYTDKKFGVRSSLLKTKYPIWLPKVWQRFVVGNIAYCVRCGNPITDKHRLHCSTCVRCS
jgi:hypothetical protein